MYKLIIADDEKIIQTGLTKMVDWKALGFEIIGTFSDGTEVIEFLDNEPVDVVLTDIKMSHVSGIEVAKHIYEAGIPCKVVFISGYQEFELAHQAIKYGVEDYILKPGKAEDFVSVFQKVRKELDINSRDIESRRKMEKYWEEMYPVLTENFVSRLIMGAVDDKREIERRMQFLYPEVDELHCPCVLATLEIHDYECYINSTWNYSSEQLDEAIYNFVKIYSDSAIFHVIYKYREKVRLFVIMKKYQEDKEKNELLCSDILNQFVMQLTEIFRFKISFEIDRIFDCIYQVIDMSEEIIRMNIRPYGEELYRQEQIKLIMTSVMTGNINTAQKVMQNILQGFSADDTHYRMHLVVDIFSGISNLLRENNSQLYQVIAPYIDYRSILNIGNGLELNQYCDRVFDIMKGSSEKLDQTGLIKRVKEYVADHIQEDILLENVADHVFISKTHLSRTFREQTGETFQQYIGRKKMEEAARLLRDPKYKIYQVGEMLGYKTARYFSKLFYNFFGCYPNQYRKDVLKLKEVSDEEA